MPKEKVTLTIEAELMAEFRRLVDARSLSASVERALQDRIEHLRHMAAVRDFVAEYEAEEGAFTPEEIADAERLWEESDARLAAMRAAREAAAEAAREGGDAPAR